MAVSLFTHGQITTTIPKAKSVKPFVEKLISAAKQGDLASRRRVIKMIGDRIMIKSEDDPAIQRNKYGEITGGPKVVKVLFDEIAPKFADRTGGYTRIIKLAKHRIGDGSSLCVLQLVGGDDESGPQVSGQYSRRRDKANKLWSVPRRCVRAGLPQPPPSPKLMRRPRPPLKISRPLSPPIRTSLEPKRAIGRPSNYSLKTCSNNKPTRGRPNQGRPFFWLATPHLHDHTTLQPDSRRPSRSLAD